MNQEELKAELKSFNLGEMKKLNQEAKLKKYKDVLKEIDLKEDEIKTNIEAGLKQNDFIIYSDISFEGADDATYSSIEKWLKQN